MILRAVMLAALVAGGVIAATTSTALRELTDRLTEERYCPALDETCAVECRGECEYDPEFWR